MKKLENSGDNLVETKNKNSIKRNKQQQGQKNDEPKKKKTSFIS